SGPSDFAATARNCNWIAHYLKNKDKASEPEWYAILGLVPFLSLKGKAGEVTGSALAHVVSKGHEGYDEEATYLKYRQVIAAQSGPTTCAKFKAIDPARCEGCPFAATVKTPVNTARLSRPATKAVTLDTEVTDDEGNKE